MPELLTSDAQILFIRHGQSAANLDPSRYQGRGNHFDITETGKEQARLLGPWLKKTYDTPSAVITSPAVRARRTAQIALEAADLQLPVSIDDNLQELSRGDWEGALHAEKDTPEELQRMVDEGMNYRTPGGESFHDVQARMLRAVETVPKGTVWMFGHGLAFRCLVGAVRGWDVPEILAARQDMFNTSVTHFSRQAGGLTVPAFGLVEHLPPELQTL